MTSALALLSAAAFLTAGLLVFGCVLMGAWAERQMQLPVDSDFEEA